MTKKYYRNIIFSKTPLKTHLKAGEHFQIYPCDFPNAPKSPRGFDFPLIIEYWVDDDIREDVSSFFEEFEDVEGIEYLKDSFSRTAIQTVKLSQITRLLSVATNHRVFQLSESEYKWGVPLPNKKPTELTEDQKDKLNNSPSQLIMGIYTYPEMWKDLVAINFTEQRHANSIFTPHRNYYVNEPIVDRNKHITFPDTIFQIIENYFELEPASKKIIDSITHLICNGVDIRMKMKSLSFLSFVSAIETIVNFELKDKRSDIEFECNHCHALKTSPISCHYCGKPIWGVKVKFKEFLKTYVAKDDYSVKKYNKIYKLRSEIVHNGILLLGDEQLDWSKSDQPNSQYITHLEAMQIAKLSVVNWLLLGPNKKLVE